MSKSDDAQAAMDDVLNRYVDGRTSIARLVADTAPAYGITGPVLQAWIARRFPTANSLAAWRREQKMLVREYRAATEKWVRGVWRACGPDGQPDWDYCYNRFVEAHPTTDKRLQIEAKALFRKHETEFQSARDSHLAAKQNEHHAPNN